MYSTIVVGTDGSPDAAAALRAAVGLAKLEPTVTVHVVSASHPMSASATRHLRADLPAEMRPLIHAHVQGEANLNTATELLAAAGIEAHCHEVDAEPATALIEAAERVKADLIIVGSRGQGPTGRLLHGSVSTRVFHRAPCSVLVAKA